MVRKSIINHNQFYSKKPINTTSMKIKKNKTEYFVIKLTNWYCAINKEKRRRPNKNRKKEHKMYKNDIKYSRVV